MKVMSRAPCSAVVRAVAVAAGTTSRIATRSASPARPSKGRSTNSGDVFFAMGRAYRHRPMAQTRPAGRQVEICRPGQHLRTRTSQSCSQAALSSATTRSRDALTLYSPPALATSVTALPRRVTESDVAERHLVLPGGVVVVVGDDESRPLRTDLDGLCREPVVHVVAPGARLEHRAEPVGLGHRGVASAKTATCCCPIGTSNAPSPCTTVRIAAAPSGAVCSQPSGSSQVSTPSRSVRAPSSG